MSRKQVLSLLRTFIISALLFYFCPYVWRPLGNLLMLPVCLIVTIYVVSFLVTRLFKKNFKFGGAIRFASCLLLGWLVGNLLSVFFADRGVRRVASELESYRSANGSYPESLSQACIRPAYLGAEKLKYEQISTTFYWIRTETGGALFDGLSYDPVKEAFDSNGRSG